MTPQEALEIVSYKLGLKLGEAALEDPLLDPAVVKRAISDEAAGKAREIATGDYFMANKLVKDLRSEHSRLEGEAWLAENSGKDGVTVTESGLQYEILSPGDGPRPQSGDTVEVDYEGTLISGVPFDSSYDRGERAVFPVGGVIQGWQEGLQLMNVGAEYRFFIPQELAYGERGAGSDIPPYSALIFDVKLHTIL